ncbi:hypothetical protein, partial [Falsigemmobacter intermedius]
MAGIFFFGEKSEPADKAEGSICMVWVCENWDGLDFPNSADTKDRNPITAKPPPSAQWLWETASTIRIDAAPWKGWPPIVIVSVVLSWIVIGPALMSHKSEDKALLWPQKALAKVSCGLRRNFPWNIPDLALCGSTRRMKINKIFTLGVLRKNFYALRLWLLANRMNLARRLAFDRNAPNMEISRCWHS